MPQLSVNMPVNCPVKQPARWPFPPRKPVSPRRSRALSPARYQRTRVRPSSVSKTENGMSKMAMLADIGLVAMWAAEIPGFMWLGAAAGF